MTIGVGDTSLFLEKEHHYKTINYLYSKTNQQLSSFIYIYHSLQHKHLV